MRISLSRLASSSPSSAEVALSALSGPAAAMVCYQALGPFRLTCRSSAIVLVGRLPHFILP